MSREVIGRVYALADGYKRHWITGGSLMFEKKPGNKLEEDTPIYDEIISNNVVNNSNAEIDNRVAALAENMKGIPS